MEEQLKTFYKVKSRNEMKTINVVFVSDELVGETIVTRKEYDKALKQKGKTETEKSKSEEAQMVNTSKSRKRKASEGAEEDINPKKPKIDEVELALAALVQDDEEIEDAGKEDIRKEDDGKETAKKEDASKKDANKKDKSKKDTSKEDTNKKDKSKRDSSKEDTNKKDKSKRDSSKDDTNKKDKSKRDSSKEDTNKKDKSKRDSSKEDTNKKDKSKRDSSKDDTNKKDKSKRDSSKEDSNKKDKSKRDSSKEDINKKDKSKRDSSKEDSNKKDKKKDTDKEDTNKKDKKKEDTDKEDTNKKDKKKEDTDKEDTNKKDKKKEDIDKEDTNKKDKKKEDTDKEDTNKKDKKKEDTDKEDTNKKDKKKEDTDKEETDKKSAGKESSEAENVEAEDVRNVPMEQLRILMGDERDISSGADYTIKIVTLESCVTGERMSHSEGRGSDNSRARSSQGNETKEKVTTPYSLRKRVIKDIKKIQRILENSDTEDDDVSTSESEFLESSEESETEEKANTAEKGETSGKAEITEEQPMPSTSSAINYFEAQSIKRNITSNNTLKNLKNPTMTQKELNKIVRKFKLSPGHKSAIKSLINETTMCFSKWDFLLKNNFNILLYGVGCKREIVNNFVDRFARKYPLIVVNGFFPDLSVREITEKICGILEIGATKIDITAEINRKLNEYHVEIYIVVNNIDGLMLRNKKTQTILSQYAKMEGIHILATIDHINAPLMWDKSTFSDFNWIWYDATTFLNYTDEVVYEGNIMLQGNGKLTLSSLRNVYNSLTKNSRSIFLLMAKRELNTPTGIRRGLSFKELYQACRKELLISSDVALRTLLKEFIDHAIVKTKKNADGDEVFVITLETNILKQFLEDQEQR